MEPVISDGGDKGVSKVIIKPRDSFEFQRFKGGGLVDAELSKSFPEDDVDGDMVEAIIPS